MCRLSPVSPSPVVASCVTSGGTNDWCHFRAWRPREGRALARSSQKQHFLIAIQLPVAPRRRYPSNPGRQQLKMPIMSLPTRSTEQQHAPGAYHIADRLRGRIHPALKRDGLDMRIL